MPGRRSETESAEPVGMLLGAGPTLFLGKIENRLYRMEETGGFCEIWWFCIGKIAFQKGTQ